MKKTIIFVLIAAYGIVACVPISASASLIISITDVDIIPDEPSMGEIITIFASGGASSSPSWVDHTEFLMEDTSLRLDLFIDRGLFAAFSTWTYSGEILPLPAETYSLTVRAFDNSVGSLEDTYTTQFTVVPEPGTVLLLGLGSLGLIRRGRE